MVIGDSDATKHCRAYGQVCHSNPDMETVEDLEAEFMNSVGFFFCTSIRVWILKSETRPHNIP